jgi:hypothetical protein
MKDEMIETELRDPVTLEHVAITAYDAVRAYAKANGDNHHRRWGGLTPEHKQTLIEGVLFHILNYRNGTPVNGEAAHLHRCKQLMQAGWRYGPFKDVEGKLTPILVSWADLSPLQRHYYRDFCTIAVNKGMYVDESELPGLTIVTADTLSQIVGADVALVPQGDGIEDALGDPHGRQIGVGGAAPQGESVSSETGDTSSDHQSSDAPEGDGSESPTPPTPSHTSSTDSPSETSESSNGSETMPPDTEQAGESSSMTESSGTSTEAA